MICLMFSVKGFISALCGISDEIEVSEVSLLSYSESMEIVQIIRRNDT